MKERKLQSDCGENNQSSVRDMDNDEGIREEDDDQIE